MGTATGTRPDRRVLLLALTAVLLTAGCGFGDPAPRRAGIRTTPDGAIEFFFPSCSRNLERVTAKPLDDRTVGALFWQVSGPVARATVQGDFTVGSASQFRDVALAPAGPLPALFEVGLGCQGDDYEYEVVVNTAGLPKENPSDGKFWQQPVGDTGYVARSAQEITDAECRSDR